MGLRHRTPMSALREQRRCADQRSQRYQTSRTGSFPRKGRLRFTPISAGPGEGRLSWASGPFDALPVPEKCQMLLARLRLSLTPQDDASRLASQAVEIEYNSLQEELMRLANHTSQLREDSDSYCRELMIPMSFNHPGGDSDAPYRSLKIDANKTPIAQNLKPLRSPLADLSLYHEPESRELASPPPLLTLVSKSIIRLAEVETEQADAEKDLSSTDPELGQEAAQLMQKNLRPARSTTVEIPNGVIMSLLDS